MMAELTIPAGPSQRAANPTGRSHKLRRLYYTALLLACLVPATPIAVAATEPQEAFSLATFRSTPEESFIKESEGWMVQIRSTESRLHFGLEMSAQPEVTHSFEYSVPYDTRTETRYFSLYTLGLALHLVPCPTCFISPYIGYSAALGMVRDHASDSPWFTTPEEYTRIGLGGPVAGVILLPRGKFSLFAEVREQGIIYGELLRERTVSIDMLGQRTTELDEVTLKSKSALVGIRINY